MIPWRAEVLAEQPIVVDERGNERGLTIPAPEENADDQERAQG
jgi:hypothetical protein